MKKSISLLIFFVLALLHNAMAQNASFISQGKIEYECKFNLYSLLDENDPASRKYKNNVSQFKVTFFDLLFTINQSLYLPGKKNPDNNKLSELPAEENIVYSSLDQMVFRSQKKVFEKMYLIEDSIRRIKWRITGEKRIIAGFECKRANAIIMDSVYVVAFFTEEILTNSGPESFCGLPGMILGVALPHEHISWFATKVYAVNINDKDIAIPLKGTKTTNAKLISDLETNYKNWGKYASFYRNRILL